MSRYLFKVSIKYDGFRPRQIKFKSESFDEFIEDLKRIVEDLRQYHNQFAEPIEAEAKAKTESGEDHYGP